MSQKLMIAKSTGADIDHVSGRDDGEGPSESQKKYVRHTEERINIARRYAGIGPTEDLTETEFIEKYGTNTPF